MCGWCTSIHLSTGFTTIPPTNWHKYCGTRPTCLKFWLLKRLHFESNRHINKLASFPHFRALLRFPDGAKDSAKTSRLALALFPQGESTGGVKVLVTPGLRMNAAIPPFPYMPSWQEKAELYFKTQLTVHVRRNRNCGQQMSRPSYSTC